MKDPQITQITQISFGDRLLPPEQKMVSPSGSASSFWFWVRPEAEKRNLRNLCNRRILILVFEGVLNKERKT
jgi:hypothetical protein